LSAITDRFNACNQLSQRIKVVPLKAQVADLEAQVADLEEGIAKRDKIVSDWSEARKSSQKEIIEPLLENYKKLESHFAECQSNLKQWSAECQNIHKQWKDAFEGCRKENSEVQKTLNRYVNNCSIISEIRNLDKRKATIDNNVQNGYVNQQPESNDLQVRILVYQQKLGCEPN
jgi:septation ring formation regulator EzrA